MTILIKAKRKPTAGIEPATFRLQGGCSTTKLRWLSRNTYLHRYLLIQSSRHLPYRVFVADKYLKMKRKLGIA